MGAFRLITVALAFTIFPGPVSAAEGNGHLYPVSLNPSIERGQISGKVKGKKRLKFRTKSFQSKVRKYDVFLVLDAAQSGVIAEIVVRKVKKRKWAQATVVRQAGKRKLRDFKGMTIIRLEDLRETMGDSLIFRENPLIHVGYARSSFVFTAANVLTGANLNPLVLGSSFFVEVFAPKEHGMEWLNWFGARYRQEAISGASLNLRHTGSDRTAQATLSGRRSHAEIMIQPWFDSVVYHAAFIVGASNSIADTVTINDESKGEVVTLSLDRSYRTYGFQLALNPIPNIYIGVTGRSAPGSEFTTEEISTSSNITGSGTWASTTVDFWGGLLQPLAGGVKLHVRVAVKRSQDAISGTTNVGSGQDVAVTDWGTAIQFGVVYAP